MSAQEPTTDRHASVPEGASTAPHSLQGSNDQSSAPELSAGSGAVPPSDLTGLKLEAPKTWAAGAPGVRHALEAVGRAAGPTRGLRVLGQLNQVGGFDCPSCAWPDPDAEHRSTFEFCENGAKAVASEATNTHADADFFARHPVGELAGWSDHQLERAGRLVEPLVLEPGDDHYRPISWDDAFARIAEALNDLESPDRAIFYTSGRTSNEAAFLYQLFVRQFGTNNLPDCSNMCHESSGVALKRALGFGKGSVRFEDFDRADVVLLVGQNPGTNHPRMLSTLQRCARRGTRLVAINPLKEAGLLGFAHPQEPIGMLGIATALVKDEDYYQVRIGEDQAFFRGVAKALLEIDRADPGAGVDRAFLDEYAEGFVAYEAFLDATPWERITERSGIDRARIEALASRLAGTPRIIACWAMGLTQHRSSVATVREVVNVLLMRGAIGVPGAGVCPVRGHSNVQGDRSMGITPYPPAGLLDALGARFGFEPPRRPGWDTVEAIGAMHDGRAEVFLAMGGNFLSATPDTLVTAEALRRCRLTAQVSTKLNRSHLITGRTALILPCLGRTERDDQQGAVQFVTVENAMGIVHRSEGTLEPASEHLLSEPTIVARLARATLGARSTVPWEEWAADYDRIREAIAEVLPGFEDLNRRVREPGGFPLYNPLRERIFRTPDGKAHLDAQELPKALDLEPDRLILMTIRSHDQFNTTVYGLNDRYRGVKNERRVVFLNPEDMAERGLGPRQEVDLLGHYNGQVRRAHRFLVVPYDIPRRCAAAYFPETNVLVPVDSVAEGSNTPTSKSIVISLEPIV